MFIYTLAVACFLLFLSFFIRKAAVFAMMIPAWFGVIILSEPQFEKAQYIQAVAGIAIIFAIIKIFQTRREGDLF